MPSDEWEEHLQRAEEAIYTYKECDAKGHYWKPEKPQWFRYGWRWPWRTRMWDRCSGCGWAQLRAKDGRPSKLSRPWPRYRS